MKTDNRRFRYATFLIFLIGCALLLTARLVYVFLNDAQRFPVNTVKIEASYQHITHKQLEAVLNNYLNGSFFSLPAHRLKMDLNALAWCAKANVERIWPDTLKITVLEKSPVAFWNDALMMEDGQLVNIAEGTVENMLPHLSGPENQQMEVLQIYQKLSKLLAIYGLHAAALELRKNQAWELSLTNGVLLRLGKQDLEKRLQRFCKAYPAVFADKPEKLASVDLRYARGMAVQWKQPMRK